VLYGQQYPAGIGASTVLAGGDYETYSEAGYHFVAGKWKPQKKGAKSGLEVVGGWGYSRHPTTVVLVFVYDLKDGRGKRRWVPGDPNPADIFEHIARGGLFEAYNSFFEWCIWNNVCCRLYGWPALPLQQVRDVMAKASAFTIPGGLALVADALETDARKDDAGTRVMRKVTKPKSPTQKDARQQYTRAEDPELFEILDSYCADDVRAEDAVSLACPDLSPLETEVFLLDQKINARGVYVDVDGVHNCIEIIKLAEAKYNAEVRAITGGAIETADKVPALKKWLASQGVHTSTVTKDWVEAYLGDSGFNDSTPEVRRVLEIRQILGSKSVQKTFALALRYDADGRVRGLFKFCGAGRTWRFAGVGPQPQNLPGDGPPVAQCAGCDAYRAAYLWFCPQCFSLAAKPDAEWCSDAAEQCLATIATRDLVAVETLWGDPLTAVAGCLRSLFTAAPGHELISSDYSAIEAVVLAVIAGEEWRLEIFQTHGKIYEACQARITGEPLADILAYKERTGNHHPDRKKFGKIPELASGYGGGLKAWHNFGADKYMGDSEITANIRKWRKDSPNICKFWYGIEELAIAAVDNPGQRFTYRTKYAEVAYEMVGDVLYCHLPSGRPIPYHSPEISHGFFKGRATKTLSYLGLVKKNWVRIETWGGGLTENIVQALARDILVNALLALEAAGYPIVLHVHDEAIAEVPRGLGSIEHFEAVGSVMPRWAKGWPIVMRGGWRGHRFRKE